MTIGVGLWAYAFSLNELSGAVLRYHSGVAGYPTSVIAGFILALATTVTIIVAACTITITMK